MAKKKTGVKAEVHEAIQTVDAGEQFTKKAVEAADDKDENDPNRLVKIILPVRLRIKRKDYAAGPHIVPAHMIDTMVEMVDKKKRADISIFTGNNYLVQRMIDRSLVVSKVENLDLNKLVR